MPNQLNSSIAELQDEVVDDFALFDDWADKYAYIIEIGKKVAPLPDSLKTEEYIVPGCQSRVWLIPSYDNGRVQFQANSDAFISGGLIALAVKVYSGHTPGEIISAPPDFIQKMDMSGNISMARMNGLQSVINKIKYYAQGYQQAAKDRRES